MTYLLLAVLVAIGSVLIPTIIGALISRKNTWRTITFGVIATVVYALLYWFFAWKSGEGFYAPLPYFGSALLGFLIALVITIFSEDVAYGEFKPKASIPVGWFILVALLPMGYQGCIASSDAWWNAKPKAELIGKVEVIEDLNEAMTPADVSHISLVDEGMAQTAAQNALSKFRTKGGSVAGSRYSIGDGTKAFVDGQLWWIFPVEFQGWLKWRMDREVPGYLRVSAEDPFAEGQAVQTDKQGKEIKIRYLESACWEYQVERHLRYHGYLGKYLLDWTFEPDDNWRPYYTVTVAERQFGYEGLKVVGIVKVDVQTGDLEFQALNKIDNWIDRVIPLNIIDYNLKKWGLFNQEGWWYTLWHDDKSQQPTPGWFLTYDANGAQWFSGFTSTNKNDQALTGFSVINAMTMQTRFFRASGVTEEKSYDAANSLWNNYPGTKPCEMVPYNIDGALAYVIPMKFENQFKGVSIIALNNVAIKAMGNTFAQALANFRSVRAMASEGRVAPESGLMTGQEIRGKVDRVGVPVLNGNITLFYFTLQGVSKRFQAVDSQRTLVAPLLRPGDEVTCRFTAGLGATISCDEILVAGVEFEDANPAQARLNANQATVKTEEKRIENQEGLERLRNSQQLNGINPKKLREFLNSQEDTPTTTK